MNEVYIDIRKENSWIKQYFDTDFVSIDKLLAVIEDLDSEIEVLKEKIEDLEKSEQERYEDYKWGRADEYHDLQKIGEI